ncbi:hypothetical protein FRC20_011116 [Serendipita sp. 405]|nr:hypothetical protein FRC20_011116 [Serendipita sp. 405]
MMAYRFQIEDIRVEATAGVNWNAMYLNNLKKKQQQQEQPEQFKYKHKQLPKLYNSAVGHTSLDSLSLPRLPNDDEHDDDEHSSATPASTVRLARSLRTAPLPPPLSSTSTSTRRFYSPIPTANLNNTNTMMQQQQQQHPDDLYSLDSYLLEQQSLHQQHTLYQQQQQYYQQQQQQQQQHHGHHQPQLQQQQQQQQHHHARQPSSANGHFQPVHRHLPSTRSYSYHPYSSTPVTPATPSPPPTSYLAPWDLHTAAVAGGVGSYMFADSTYGALLDYDYSSNGTIHPSQLSLTLAAATTTPNSCSPLETGLHSFGAHSLYTSPITINPTTISPYLTYTSSTTTAQQQQLPTCIAPEALYSPHPPMTPVSPRSLQDSSSSDSSSSLDSASNPSQSTRSSPTRLGLSIPTASLANPINNESWLSTSGGGAGTKYTGSSNPSSTLSSPVESLSSHVSSDLDNDNEPSFVPPPSLKKSTQSMMMSVRGSNKRATRSAGPEPAWVDAVSAEDVRRMAEDVAAANANANVNATAASSPVSPTSATAATLTATTTSGSAPARPTNRPIAFACVFCRHRKIQCIRPKTEVAPGEKPPPCK